MFPNVSHEAFGVGGVPSCRHVCSQITWTEEQSWRTFTILHFTRVTAAVCAAAASVGVGPPLRLIFPLKVNHSAQSFCVSVEDGINQGVSLRPRRSSSASLSEFADDPTGRSAEVGASSPSSELLTEFQTVSQ